MALMSMHGASLKHCRLAGLSRPRVLPARGLSVHGYFRANVTLVRIECPNVRFAQAFPAIKLLIMTLLPFFRRVVGVSHR